LAIVGPDRFIRVNRACERILGYSNDEMTSQPWINLVAPEDRDRMRSTLGAFEGSIEPTRFESRMICKDGACRWIEWNVVWHGGPGVCDRPRCHRAPPRTGPVATRPEPCSRQAVTGSASWSSSRKRCMPSLRRPARVWLPAADQDPPPDRTRSARRRPAAAGLASAGASYRAGGGVDGPQVSLGCVSTVLSSRYAAHLRNCAICRAAFIRRF